MHLLLQRHPLNVPSEVSLFFLLQIIPISAGMKMSDLQKHTALQRFQPAHCCHLDKIVINWKIWRIICLSKSRRGYNSQIFCWLRPSVPVFKAPQTLCNLFENVFERTYMSNTCTHCTPTWELTDLEQLQYDLCEGSTKSQAPTFSVSSSSQVPLVAAENFRLGRRRKNKLSDTTLLRANFDWV